MTTVYQTPLIDTRGNISVHGRSGFAQNISYQDVADISERQIFFEVQSHIRLALAAGTTVASRIILVEDSDVEKLPVGFSLNFAVRDETDDLPVPVVIWSGRLTVFGYAGAPEDEP